MDNSTLQPTRWYDFNEKSIGGKKKGSGNQRNLLVSIRGIYFISPLLTCQNYLIGQDDPRVTVAFSIWRQRDQLAAARYNVQQWNCKFLASAF